MSQLDPQPDPANLTPSDRSAVSPSDWSSPDLAPTDLATYDQDAVQEILQLALAKRGDIEGYSRSQLLEMGQELGLSEADITAAETKWQEIYGDQGDRARFQASEKARIQRRAVKVAIVTLFLSPINWILAHHLDWSLIVARVWGLFIALDAWKSKQPGTDTFEKRFQNWQNDQKTIDDWT